MFAFSPCLNLMPNVEWADFSFAFLSVDQKCTKSLVLRSLLKRLFLVQGLVLHSDTIVNTTKKYTSL